MLVPLKIYSNEVSRMSSLLELYVPQHLGIMLKTQCGNLYTFLRHFKKNRNKQHLLGYVLLTLTFAHLLAMTLVTLFAIISPIYTKCSNHKI